MSYYDERQEELVDDTKKFLASEYGQHIMGILRDKAQGYLSIASVTEIKYPERYLAKYNSLKEMWNLIYQPLDDDTPPLG